MITLRHGNQVSRQMFTSTMIALHTATCDNASVVFALVAKCKNPNDKLSTYPCGNAKEILMKHGLIDQNERIQAAVRMIILNSFEGEGRWMKLVDPMKKL